ncbi:beta-N-acetylhexosaminidase [Actinophytocola xinjiangensis]|uniref:beta-N-acetylhexosaminidase n=1 Tax=Actinophytocola xinjiangensis TaxID=485602 RepID=A0A7Z1B028_9PSEU|nr:family 20 glycosylhydrolase [Actinophytocola xinjiangensis]OLF12876.1 beta-N-acetylhexosaminidase [Actinophytocola xinjiangensis]
MFEALLPRPVRVDPAAGVYRLTGLPSQVSTVLTVDPVAVPRGFRVTITPSAVTTVAADAAGAYYAEGALRQLLGPDAFRAADIHEGEWTLPCGLIEDHPRFGWRGCLLDVARHFLPKAGVLRFLDLMAVHRLNVLHLHLTDDQGWRIEIPAHPRLTSVGAWRAGSWVGRQPDGTPDHDGRPHGGYYTTDDLREIVAYAAARHITVVPEIDVPGHSQAAIAAYPWLGVTGAELPVWTAWGVSENILNPTDEAVEFYREVLTHVASVFPSPVICVGGDEVPTTQWTASPAVRQRAVDLGLPSPAHLHGWFVSQLVDHLATLGRRALGWDELLDTGPLPPSTIIGAWRDNGRRAIESGREVVLCPEQHTYLDHRQSDHPDEPIPVGYLRTLADVYAYEPAAGVLGAQAQLWTEHLDTPRRIDYAAFPRLSAFAEVVWSDGPRSYDEFRRRLERHHLPRLDALGVEYRPLTGPHPWQTRPGVPGRPRNLT